MSEVNTDRADVLDCLGLTLDAALRLPGAADLEIRYTRPVRGATDSATARVVRVEDGVITAAFFNDTLKEDDK